MTIKLIVLACFLAISQAHVIDIKRLHSRIVGGQDALPGEFPHQVSLQAGLPPLLPFTHFCGGAILNERWVMTAVHCVQLMEEYPVLLVVKAGKHDLTLNETSEQESFVEAKFTHENYTTPGQAGPYDIALIKLTTPFRFNKRVAPISLPKKNSEPSGPVFISGWGAVKDNGTEEGLEMPNILQKAKLEIVDRVSCRKALLNLAEEESLEIDEGIVHETNICTGPLFSGMSPCDGDSGGPLISRNKNGKSEVVGVTSWVVSPCGRKGGPAVYVRVSSFVDWIENIISKN